MVDGLICTEDRALRGVQCGCYWNDFACFGCFDWGCFQRITKSTITVHYQVFIADGTATLILGVLFCPETEHSRAPSHSSNAYLVMLLVGVTLLGLCALSAILLLCHCIMCLLSYSCCL